MPYTVRRKLKPVLIPRMTLRGLDQITPGALIAQMRARLDQAHEEMGSRPEITAADFNAIVTRLNEVSAELGTVTGAIPARLEMESARVIAAFDHLMATGQLPPDWDGNGGGGVPWLLLGIGAVALGGLAWWVMSRRELAEMDAAIERGDFEDCGCDG